MNTHNLISQENEVQPNYSIDDQEIAFDAYMSPDQQVCIVGRLDNNYICWCSITHVNDISVNAEIFNHVINQPIRSVSTMYRVLSDNYTEVITWHKLHIEKRQYNSQDYYYSPAASIYFKDSNSFALEISRFYTKEKLKCDFRLLGNTYIILLEAYKQLICKVNPVPHDYYEMKPMIDILENESYIKLCTDSEIRILYLDCLEGVQFLYNRYMNDAH